MMIQDTAGKKVSSVLLGCIDFTMIGVLSH